ncbi:hypothetical protein GUJ93_ZPchr0006g45079 [Zizania palustris]|uniref:Cytochrome b561 domain-containing protein n=1 Tax=Zizania palustris TaxID=103762 RepID=A0A8J5SL29_ZIZPA|nr:hypothetical protein GUJ93_ZPchr0006g45079 [Zizania palustris]
MGIGVRAAPFTYVAHALAVAAAAMVLLWCIHFRGGLAIEAANKNLIFNVHPVLMLIGYIILGSEAIMVYKVLPAWNHDTTKLDPSNSPRNCTCACLHSWLGIGTICLYGIQWIFGFVAFFYPRASPSLRKGALPWHILFGLFVYILALATAELGFLEKLTFLQSSGLDKYGAEAFLVNFTALVVVLFGASVVVAAVSPARPEEPRGYAPISVN